MPEIPECLHRRYRALDDLIKELSSMSNRSSFSECIVECANDPGVKLMCDFWNILKEHPDCNLKKEVEQHVKQNPSSYNQCVTCYMVDGNKREGTEENPSKEETYNKGPCCHDMRTQPVPLPVYMCCSTERSSPSSTSDAPPLTRVLCDLNKAASYGKDCSARVNDLMVVQANLKEQVQQLEDREKNGVILLKQADCMWACMEDAYKKKIGESLERQKDILKELKELEANTAKWRKNKKELEYQTNNVVKCHQEIAEKINQKINDKKCLEAEIDDFNKRIESNKKDLDAAKKMIPTKKRASDANIAKIAAEMKKKQLKLQELHKYKKDKELEGKKYIKEAREDLQKICSTLLQKKLENEDLKAEKEALILEIEILKQACGECRDSCKNKKQAVLDEIKSLDAEIANFRAKCIKCHESVDTSDVRKLCTDCPRCTGDRECLYEDGQCSPDPTADCICMSVKHKFLDNVFDNMYTVLEKEAKTAPGKAVGEAVLKCLKRSKNGKLDSETREILRQFILSTVKKNLNLTIVGGAVKTRCEMDPETYKQMMLCLKEVKMTQPRKTDKGTIAKKEACSRWGSSSECNCPKGPKACVCSKKVEKETDNNAPDDFEDKGKTLKVSPKKDKATCSVHHAHVRSSIVGTEIASRSPSPCKGSICNFSKNMRATQCVFGPDSLTPMPKSKVTPMPVLDSDSQLSCTCGKSMKAYKFKENKKHQPRDYIIEEVMGRHTEVMSIENVKKVKVRKSTGKKSNSGCSSRQKVKKHTLASETSMQYVYGKEIKSGLLQSDPNNCILDQEQSNKNAKLKKFNHENKSFTQSIIRRPRFQISILNENGQMQDHFTELIVTSSGILALEIDDEVIETFDKRMKKDPTFMGLLKKYETGYFNIAFSIKEGEPNDSPIIKIKRAHSGTILFQGSQNFISILKSDQTVLNSVRKDVMKNISATHIKIIRKRKEIMNAVRKAHNEENNVTKTMEKYLDKSHTTYKSLLQKYYDQGKKTITLKIQDDKDLFEYVMAGIRKMSSANVVLVINNALHLGKFISDTKEYPVLLDTSDSDTLLLDLRKQSAKSHNAILKRVFGGFLLIVNESMMKRIDDDNELTTSSGKEYFKFRINAADISIDNPPAVLKLTSSNNCIISLDKEYEKEYKESISQYINNDYKCYVNLKKTYSGIYIITFEGETNDEIHSEGNSYLVNSTSGTMKIVSSGPEFDYIESSLSGPTCSFNVFGELLNKLPKSILEHQKYTDKNRYQNQPKNTRSNLSTFSKQKPSQDMVPIRRTKSGRTVIIYNDEGSEDQTGTLRISPSGNIYLLIDEKVILKICNDVNNTTGNLCNKRVGLTYNTNTTLCLGGYSKCYYDELQTDRFISCPNIFFSSENNKICTNCKVKRSSLPNINKMDILEDNVKTCVITKSFDCQTVLAKKSNKYCGNYLSKFVCPFQEDRNKQVSSELLPLSGLNSNSYVIKNTSKPKVCAKSTKSLSRVSKKLVNPLKINFDYIENLPPQLPAFLKDFSR